MAPAIKKSREETVFPGGFFCVRCHIYAWLE